MVLEELSAEIESAEDFDSFREEYETFCESFSVAEMP